MEIHNGAPVFMVEYQGNLVRFMRNYPERPKDLNYSSTTGAYYLKVRGEFGAGFVALSEEQMIEMFQTFLEIRETYVHP